MPESGLMFEKEPDSISHQIITLFEKTRVAYLSAKADSKNYGSRWRKAVEDIREEIDDLDSLGRQLKTFLEEKDLEDKEAMNPESLTAKKIYDGIKELRFKSEDVMDPFSKRFKDDVLENLLESPETMVKFIHYALRSDNTTLPDELYEIKDMEPDDLTAGMDGLDISPDDIPLYIVEHYGDGKNSKKVESKFKAALNLLKLIFLSKYSKKKWAKLLGIELKKAEEKALVNFIVPNKPMYRIFDIEDMNELKGFSGEYVVQEKYDGMRIQIHKIDNNVKIYSYNEKDITEKCPQQVKVMKLKHFGDCILDAELILFDGDKALHRADTIAHVFKNKYKDAELKAHVFDIMRHENQNLIDEPLRERINILFNNYSLHSDDKLAFPSKKDTRIADTMEDIETYSKGIMEMPTSEGVVIKDIESTYFIGTRKNPKWIKWKKFVDLDLIVLDKKKTKSNMYSYALGAAAPNEEGKYIEEIHGRQYMNVGKANNTKLDVDIGDIVRVKVDEVKSSDERFTIYGSKIIEIPEVDQPDKTITLEMLSKDTKPSLKFKAKALKKGIMITDLIHGEAILKSMDGFTLYEFEKENLMSKNAMANLDMWKEEAENIMKTKQSKLTVSVFNYLKSNGAKTPREIHNFLVKHHPDLYDDILDSKMNKIKEWLEQRDGMSFDERTDKLYAEDDKIMADSPIIKYETPKEYQSGEFKLHLREDDNLNLSIKLGDTSLVWTIDLNTNDDIFALFGKAAKFPAEVARNVSKKKLVDTGEIKLGVQRNGYHEYFLSGNKFETKIHFRLLPVDDKEMWLAWTGYRQEPADKEGDEGLWNINEDKFFRIKIPNSE